MEKYRNRTEAGKLLAKYLEAYADRNDVIVLALPRGGVPVGYEIAKVLQVPLDVFIVRKLGVPGHSELAMGALAEGDVLFFNEDIIRSLQIPQFEINRIIAEEKKELERRQLAYRGSTAFPNLQNKKVILVDDGIATGATIRAAIIALRQLQPAKIIIAIPVADKTLCDKLRTEVDEFLCPFCPYQLYAVGAWYEDFSQTEDAEVQELLKSSKEFSTTK